jgi:hypothetical protein
MGYYARDIKATAATSHIILENQALCWNPSISGTKTEDGFIATGTGPRYITSPVLFPAHRCKVGDNEILRAGLLVVQ